jgi:mycofactocin precursor
LSENVGVQENAADGENHLVATVKLLEEVSIDGMCGVY